MTTGNKKKKVKKLNEKTDRKMMTNKTVTEIKNATRR